MRFTWQQRSLLQLYHVLLHPTTTTRLAVVCLCLLHCPNRPCALLFFLQSSGSVKSLAKSVSEVSLNGQPSNENVSLDESPRTVTGAHEAKAN
jgi:hypothetical protein